MRLGVILHRPLGAFGQLARDGLLHRIGQISPILLRLAGLSQTRRRRLQPREGEVAVLPPQQRSRQLEPRPVAGRRQLLQRRSARIAQPHSLGDLVEGLARRVVDGRAQSAHVADAAHLQQLAVPARDQQQQERIGRLRPQPRRHRMTFQMVDRDQRQPPRQRRRLAVGQAHHDPADQARPRRRRHAVQRAPVQPGLGHGPTRHAVDHLHMAAGGDFRHHPAIGRMIVDLAVDDAGQHLGARRRQSHHRGGGLVAAGLEPQHGQTVRPAFGCPVRRPAIVRVHLHWAELATRPPFRNGVST